jgi:hypothetical protein
METTPRFIGSEEKRGEIERGEPAFLFFEAQTQSTKAKLCPLRSLFFFFLISSMGVDGRGTKVGKERGVELLIHETRKRHAANCRRSQKGCSWAEC